MLMPDYIMIDSSALVRIGWAALWAGLILYFLVVAVDAGSGSKPCTVAEQVVHGGISD